MCRCDLGVRSAVGMYTIGVQVTLSWENLFWKNTQEVIDRLHFSVKYFSWRQFVSHHERWRAIRKSIMIQNWRRIILSKTSNFNMKSVSLARKNFFLILSRSISGITRKLECMIKTNLSFVKNVNCKCGI